MLKAVLIEDDEKAREYIAAGLRKSFLALHENPELYTYDSPRDFLRRFSADTHYDVIFLDIEMPGMDGIQLAAMIRKTMPHVLIVFISSQEQLVFKSLEVQPFRFIRKQRFDEELPVLTEDLIRKINESHHHLIYLSEPSTGDILCFDSYDLLYVEAQRKDCRLITKSSQTLMRCPLNRLKSHLEEWGFIQVHRSYLVNWRAVYQIEKAEVVLINGERIPLSRGLSESVHSQFIHMIRKEE